MEACHAKDAHDEECHTALLAATAKLLADVMPCDPHCNYSLPAVPGDNVRHSHSIVYAKHGTSFALLSTIVHVAKGRRQARHIVFAQVAMLHSSNAGRHAFHMCLDGTRRQQADMVTNSQTTRCTCPLTTCFSRAPCCGMWLRAQCVLRHTCACVLQAHGCMPWGLEERLATD